MSLAKQKLICAILIFLISLAVYYRTLAPTVTLVDSGELAMVCSRLDIAHPPGVPVYTLIGWAFSHLPCKSVVFRLNFMSAFFAALTASLVFVAGAKILELIKSTPVKAEKKGKRRDEGLNKKMISRGGDWLALPAALAAALTFAFSNTLWSFATVTEVYTLNLALICLIIILTVIHEERLNKNPNPQQVHLHLSVLSLIYGLALGVHHLSVLFTAPAILYFLLIRHRRIFFRPQALLIGGLFILVGLSAYAYLPLRALQKPVLNWGDPSNGQKFYWHISGRQYQTHLFSGNGLEQLGFFLNLWFEEFAYLGMIFIFMGLIILWFRNRPLFWFMSFVAFADVLYSINYDIGEDKEAYYLPVFLISALWLAIGIYWALVEWTKRRPRIARYAVVLLICLLPVLSLYKHYKVNDHHNYYIGYDYAMNVLDTVSKGGIVLTPDWQLYSPLLYLQNVEGIRPDVTLIDVNLLRRFWYMDHLRRKFSWLVASAAQEVKSYMDELHLFEYKLPPYNSSNYDPSKIQSLYVGLINAFIDKNIDSRTVYLTVQMLAPEFRGVAEKYNRVPYGLTFRLQKDKSFVEDPEPQLRIRGLLDGTAHLDAVAARIYDDYANMIYNRAVYFSLNNKHAKAIETYKGALTFKPNNSRAHWMMAKSYASLGKLSEAVEAYQDAVALEPENQTIRREFEKVKKRLSSP